MNIGDAEREASEVLHSLLSIERLEKPITRLNDEVQQVLLENCSEDSNDLSKDDEQWLGACNVSLLTHDTTTTNPLHIQQSSQPVNQGYDWNNVQPNESSKSQPRKEQRAFVSYPNKKEGRNDEAESRGRVNEKKRDNVTARATSTKKVIIRKKCKNVPREEPERESERIEGSAEAVQKRFQLGCECSDECCFKGLSAENVYKHRLNIAELTKEEHDMYLMGVTMACMADPGVTAKQRIRRRLRAQYVYQGRRVCLAAFLYLENCTLYQLKRIRKHVMTHGVTPRVHGNHGKKPHNVFPLDTYRRATEFLKDFIESNGVGGTSHPKSLIMFPPDITRKTIHNLYKETMQSSSSAQKIMGYSTFRHFMKEQFPLVRYCKQDTGVTCRTTSNSSTSSNATLKESSNSCITAQPVQQQQEQQQSLISMPCLNINLNSHDQTSSLAEEERVAIATAQPPNESVTITAQSPCTIANNTIAIQMAIPVLPSDNGKSELSNQQTAFLVTPVSSQMLPVFQGTAPAPAPAENQHHQWSGCLQLLSGYGFSVVDGC
ncbi:hypothetical protein LSTR_LSTR008371 [Laodelphax striatellus]|uniref:Uncharacterized protein n=1 Tax=Laodelphax striatellus TaxID=195883 RepID=A0A482XSI7_LAOST|nr:hypothetical protein LSTR_LSTR008371 [Laodelphax striatellus]